MLIDMSILKYEDRQMHPDFADWLFYKIVDANWHNEIGGIPIKYLDEIVGIFYREYHNVTRTMSMPMGRIADYFRVYCK